MRFVRWGWYADIPVGFHRYIVFDLMYRDGWHFDFGWLVKA